MANSTLGVKKWFKFKTCSVFDQLGGHGLRQVFAFDGDDVVTVCKFHDVTIGLAIEFLDDSASPIMRGSLQPRDAKFFDLGA